jgi:hypothetical protein
MKKIWWIGIPIILVLALPLGYFGLKQKSALERARWKDTAVERLSLLSPTNSDWADRFASMMERRANNEFEAWVDEPFLVMTNGEYLVYAFRHGRNNGFVDHLFLARGSNGRWYYSSYHFCNGMAGILSEDRPGSIDEFAQRYFVQEFDGKSPVCLERTWP